MRRVKVLTTLTLLTLLTLIGGGGCQLVRPTTDTQKLAEVVFWVNAAANTGTALALAEHPEWRPKFETALAALDALVTANSQDPTAFRNVLNSLPIKELKRPEAVIAINLASIAFQRYGQSVALDDSSYVGAAIRAVRDGMRAGLPAQ